MIVAEQKSLEEISGMISPFDKVMILGCGTCTTVCGAGGEREVSYLQGALRVASAKGRNGAHAFTEYTIKRQCDPEFLEQLVGELDDVDAVLSLGCGIGVQAVSERFPAIEVLPGVNTLFLGMTVEQGVWDERCAACGDCQLDKTGGICPVTRCTKGISNGPCAGAKNGKCEANKDMECAWIQIYQRLERTGRLDKMRQYQPPRNFKIMPRPKRLVAKYEPGDIDG